MLRTLGDESVQAVVTSPPYVDMRPEYGTPTDWLPIFQELARVVDGPMLWNVGRKWVHGVEQMWWLKIIEAATAAGWQHWDTLVWFKPNANPIQGRIATNAHEYVLAFGREGMEFNEEARKRPYAIGSAERLQRRWVSSISVKDDGAGAQRGEAQRAEGRAQGGQPQRSSRLLRPGAHHGQGEGDQPPRADGPRPRARARRVRHSLKRRLPDSRSLRRFRHHGDRRADAGHRLRDDRGLGPIYCEVLVERLGKVPRQMSLLT